MAAAGAAEVAAAVDRAAAAARGWADTPAAARAAALSAVADALAERAAAVTGLVIREVGKPRSEAAGEVARGVAILRYFAQAALLPDGDTLPSASPGALLMARRRPLGVTGLVTRWNFPVAIPRWKVAPSLASATRPRRSLGGVVRGGPDAAREILAPHLPPHVFQVVLGAGERLCRGLYGLPGVAAVFFTGSVPAGHDVVAPGGRRGRQGPGRDGRAERLGGLPTPTSTGPPPRSRTRRSATPGEVYRHQPGHRGRRGLRQAPRSLPAPSPRLGCSTRARTARRGTGDHRAGQGLALARSPASAARCRPVAPRWTRRGLAGADACRTGLAGGAAGHRGGLRPGGGGAAGGQRGSGRADRQRRQGTGWSRPVHPGPWPGAAAG